MSCLLLSHKIQITPRLKLLLKICISCKLVILNSCLALREGHLAPARVTTPSMPSTWSSEYLEKNPKSYLESTVLHEEHTLPQKSRQSIAWVGTQGWLDISQNKEIKNSSVSSGKFKCQNMAIFSHCQFVQFWKNYYMEMMQSI